jgi:hypothetical protein
MGRGKALSALFKVGRDLLPVRSGADKPRALTLSKSSQGWSQATWNLISGGAAKLFLCFSKLEAPFF